MALKRKITKVEFDALDDLFKAEYEEKDGGYVLDTDDATELRNALERQKEVGRAEKERADRLQAEKEEAETGRVAAEAETARKKGDVTAIEASWQAKVDLEKNKAKTANEKLQLQLRTLLVDNVAVQLANELSDSPKILLPHIRERIYTDFEGDEPVTRIRSPDGKPSALTVADLREEFLANADFSSIVTGTRATGGNAGQQRNGTNGSGGKKIKDMNEMERVALQKQNPDDFRRRIAAEGLIQT